MRTYTVNEISRIVKGDVVGNDNQTITSVSSDSRDILPGALFVALQGAHFDGNRFAESAVALGASAVMVSAEISNLNAPQIVVKESLQALTELAVYHRSRFPNKVAAITGSAGKTTTRALLCAILGTAFRVLEPEKNFNNHIGVPLTVMKLHSGFDMAVFELGCSDFNEIGPLTRIVNPHVAVITNVGSAHLEKLGSLQGVARAKGELFEFMPSDGCAIVNLDDPYISKMPVRAQRKITFSVHPDTDADVVLEKRIPNRLNQQLVMRIQGVSVDIPFNLPGFHNAVDATAAAAAALAMGANTSHIQQGLKTVSARPGRFCIHDKDGISVIDDSYNANPSSMAASLDVLSEMVPAPRRIAVLGDMLELGESALAAHRQLGARAAVLQPKGLFVCGEYAEVVKTSAVENGLPPARIFTGLKTEEIAKKIAEISDSGDALLIKGSRGMKLEQVVNAILKG